MFLNFEACNLVSEFTLKKQIALADTTAQSDVGYQMARCKNIWKL